MVVEHGLLEMEGVDLVGNSIGFKVLANNSLIE